jgi:hypothetical protein
MDLDQTFVGFLQIDPLGEHGPSIWQMEGAHLSAEAIMAKARWITHPLTAKHAGSIFPLRLQTSRTSQRPMRKQIKLLSFV